MDDRDLIDVNEATRLTGLDKQTLYKLARTRRLRSFRVLGRTLRFNRADLIALVQERRAVPDVPDVPALTQRGRRSVKESDGRS